MLRVNCGVSLPYDPTSGGTPPQVSKFSAILDTGASASVIDEQVVATCRLSPTGMRKVQTATELSDAETYLVNIRLPNNVVFYNVKVTKGKLGADTGLLIGMDIISQGDFTVTNKNGITICSYRYPSETHIDFVEKERIRSLGRRYKQGTRKKPKKKRPPKTRGKKKK